MQEIAAELSVRDKLALIEVDLLENNNLLKIQGVDVIELSLEDAIVYMVNDLVVNFNTLDAVTGEIQCVFDKHRSTKDLYLIMKYYFLDITLDVLAYHLVDLALQDKIYSMHCKGIKARTWFTTKQSSNHINPGLNYNADFDTIYRLDYLKFHEECNQMNKITG
jgi:hypothetical protein